ncbi:hypothetical protein ARSEF4850_007595 [Beauveria asiatica]
MATENIRSPNGISSIQGFIRSSYLGKPAIFNELSPQPASYSQLASARRCIVHISAESRPDAWQVLEASAEMAKSRHPKTRRESNFNPFDRSDPGMAESKPQPLWHHQPNITSIAHGTSTK